MDFRLCKQYSLVGLPQMIKQGELRMTHY